MCGRYGRRGDKQRIAEWMQTHNTSAFDEFDDSYLAPSYNVAPQSLQPIVKLNTETGERELTVMRWGLVPFWTLLANSLHSPSIILLSKLPSCLHSPLGAPGERLL